MEAIPQLAKICQEKSRHKAADPLLPLLMGQAKILLLRIDQNLPSSPRDLKILGTLALRIADLLERAA
jgi:hypothetical protein